MKEKPTTFELAQLAAQAAPPNTRAKDAVRRALELWSEAETGIADYEGVVGPRCHPTPPKFGILVPVQLEISLVLHG